MPSINEINDWGEKIHGRYKSYLRTRFFFNDPELRRSFQYALDKESESLFKGPFPESSRNFQQGLNAQELARECFPQRSDGLLPALIDQRLYIHQEQAIRNVHINQRNVVVTTGTASGKTESFLYPILFELYRQHLEGELDEPGVRAMILYPMNALANDQRNRLGEICERLKTQGSSFMPTFGQYIGQTPESDEPNRWRHAERWAKDRKHGELVFREEMRKNPPHILLTNYSMLEYLLIRPKDSPLFDNDFGKHWRFIVLDEAHQYRGTKGMEMGMLIRRLKQRLREGGREDRPFQCIATSATMSSSEDRKEKETIAGFAQTIFDDKFSSSDVIFGERKEQTDGETDPSRYHIFVRALEGAFLVYKNGKDQVVLNRKTEEEENSSYNKASKPLEIALCQECGQHYYVGREEGWELKEAIRDPSQVDFGVEYYLPLETDTSEMTHLLCRRCGTLSPNDPNCDCGEEAQIPVKECKPHKENPDRLKECEACGYRRGGVGDPVQEIVHGSDGPNAVIATTLHELLWGNKERRSKVLAFADNRQGAAYFAWYIEDSYKDILNRNLILRAINTAPPNSKGISIADLNDRLCTQWEKAHLFGRNQTGENNPQAVLKSIFREVLTEERRLSLEGVGLVQWFVYVPDSISNNTELLDMMEAPPWNLTKEEADNLIGYLMDEFRRKRAVDLLGSNLSYRSIFDRSQPSFVEGHKERKYMAKWGGANSAIVRHFLRRLHNGSTGNVEQSCTDLMEKVLDALRDDCGDDQILCYDDSDFRLNANLLRVRKVTDYGPIWQCDICVSLSTYNIKNICPRDRCPGNLKKIKFQTLKDNHYRTLYEAGLPPILRSEEHTAQIESNEARDRQEEFKEGKIHILSSSTTFEVGVDLGELEVVFMRNVPPEPFNYTQRAGRAGRRDTTPGLVVTYCRRNAHDLYHYEKPKERIIEGQIRAPRLKLTNTKIILRHMVATALSAFFRDNPGRFKNVEYFIGDWENPSIISDVKRFCENNSELRKSLLNIVPKDIHEAVGLNGTDWIGQIAGENSRFNNAEKEVSSDYRQMQQAKEGLKREEPKGWIDNIKQLVSYMMTIADEDILGFLSRKAIIPKYGFPVDVVELKVHQKDNITLQRDLSQAIAEYAAGSTVVANKHEWKSCGIKVVPNKACPIKYYDYDKARNFKQYKDKEIEDSPYDKRRYLSPIFGFVTPFFGDLNPPRRQTQRLYTTRPFFLGFDNKTQKPETKIFQGIEITQAQPGTLVILCEGKSRDGFYICLDCGAHFTKTQKEYHLSPFGRKCTGTIQRQLSLGYELVTDVVRIQFPSLTDEWDAYSVAYSVLLGAAEILNVPDTDLNVTTTGGTRDNLTEIVLYDNVPGGAGLVTYLEDKNILKDTLLNARDRVEGSCGCDVSCYGCLRSYRNQFAHPHLDRNKALKFLPDLL